MAQTSDPEARRFDLPEWLLRLTSEMPPAAGDALRRELWTMRERTRVLELAVTALSQPPAGRLARSLLERDGEACLAAYFALQRIGERCRAARTPREAPAWLSRIAQYAMSNPVRWFTDQGSGWELVRLGEQAIIAGASPTLPAGAF